MPLKGRTPTAEEKRHMDRVARLPCIVCWTHYKLNSPAEIHHTDGKTKQGAHFKVLPLCPPHHRHGSTWPYAVGRHQNKAEFERLYGTEAQLLEAVDRLLGKQVVRTG